MLGLHRVRPMHSHSSLDAFLSLLCQHVDIQVRRFVPNEPTSATRHDRHRQAGEHTPTPRNRNSAIPAHRHVTWSSRLCETRFCLRSWVGDNVTSDFLSPDLLDGACFHFGLRPVLGMVPFRGSATSGLDPGTPPRLPTVASQAAVPLSSSAYPDALLLRGQPPPH